MATTTAQVYQVDSLLYLGAKLQSYSDALTATTYSHTYDWNGRLTRAAASTTSTSPLAQSYGQDYSLTDPSWPLATVGNPESVTSAGQTVDYDYLADRVVSRSSGGALLDFMVYDHQAGSPRGAPTPSPIEGFVYDVEDHLKQVRRSGAVAEVLEYDPLGAVMFRKVGTKYLLVRGAVRHSHGRRLDELPGVRPLAVTTPKVGVHVLLGGSRIATVRAPPSGSTADPAGECSITTATSRGASSPPRSRAAGWG